MPTVGLRRSMSTTSRQVPWWRPVRWRVPTVRNPALACRRRLVVFSGKTPDWMVQIPAVWVESIRARSSAAAMPRPR